jgi:hypothetical protein
MLKKRASDIKMRFKIGRSIKGYRMHEKGMEDGTKKLVAKRWKECVKTVKGMSDWLEDLES